MSFQTFWTNIDAEFNKYITNIIKLRFDSLKDLPEFLGPIEVKNFDAGTQPPEVELTEVGEVYSEFYLLDDSEVLSSVYQQTLQYDMHQLEHVDETSSVTNVDYFYGYNQLQFDPNHLSISLAQIASLSHQHPMGTSGQPIDPETGWELDLDVDSDRDENEIINRNNYHLYPPTHPIHHVSGHSTPPQNLAMHSKSDEDVQLHLDINYNGDLSLNLETEFLANFPSPKFVVLPIKLKVTGFSFKARALVAYLQSKVRLSFLPPDQPEENFLNSLKVESEIGENTKHSLKNVDHVEKFVLEMVRKLLTKSLQFPNFMTYHINNNTNLEVPTS